MQNIFILTGAGISAESGLKTFRDADGLWEGHRVEDVATPEAYTANPTRVHQFYNQRRSQLLSAKPNEAHMALAELKRAYGKQLTIVTQNVDDLHERAGLNDVIHMHGELLKQRCECCDFVSDCRSDTHPSTQCNKCHQIGTVRPHIVWFGEMPLEMEQIYQQLAHTEIFAAIGTSGLVYPAAGFAAEAKRHGAKLIEVNLTDTEISPIFDEHIQGSATEVVPQWVMGLIDQV